MQLPTLLSHRNKNSYKNQFGHVLILAGSKQMLGAGALTSLAVMRSGAGLATLAIPKTLNHIAQKKVSNVVMTLPLPETTTQTLSYSAYKSIHKLIPNYNCLAIGPGLSTNKSTQKFIKNIIEKSTKPLVIDADALTTVANNENILNVSKTVKILTPHLGEIEKILKISKKIIKKEAKKIISKYAQKNNCIVVLKDSNTLVTSGPNNIYINKTGNPGMSTAGSGDVLTGIISAFLAQGLNAFEAGKIWSLYSQQSR